MEAFKLHARSLLERRTSLHWSRPMTPSKNEKSAMGMNERSGLIRVSARSDPRGTLAQPPGDCVSHAR